MFYGLVVTRVIMLALAVAGATAQAPTFVFRPLREQGRMTKHERCGYSDLRRPNYEGADVFQWDLAKEAWINVGESDIRLRLVKLRENPRTKTGTSVGDRQVVEFAGGGLRITLSTKITELCPPDSESCEVWSEEGELQVRNGRQSAKMRVVGFCGS